MRRTSLIAAVIVTMAVGASPAVATAASNSDASSVPSDALRIGAVQIVAHDGSCLDVAHAGAIISRTRCAWASTQMWRVVSTSASPAATGDAEQYVNVGTGQCLAIKGASVSPGAALVASSCQPAAPPEQLFTHSDDTATLVAANSALCLRPATRGVRQAGCFGGADERWQLDDGEIAIDDAGFENGVSGWTFGAGTGIGDTAHTGSHGAYLDAGTGTVTQRITVAKTGQLQVAAWIAAAADGAQLYARAHGKNIGALTIPTWTAYQRYVLNGLHVRAGEVVTVGVRAARAGRTDVDDVLVSADHHELSATSSDPTVAALFTWAKAQANDWVIQDGTTGPINVDERNPAGTGTATYRASYWAGYKYRTMFYGRDTAHQVVGAHLLGLDLENKNMLRALISSATPARGGYPVWSINFDTSTAGAIDYHSDTDFVREVPTVFELVQKSDEAFEWTGDRDYVISPTMWTYYLNAVTAFIASHNGRIPNGRTPVAEGVDGNIFDGVASYNEDGTTLIEAGDAIGSQYRAYLAFADLAHARGDDATARMYRARANDLRRYFNRTWSKQPGTTQLARGYQLVDGKATVVGGWGKENSVFMPLKGIVDPGARLSSYLDFIQSSESDPDTRSVNIEALTYLPDTFFANNRDATAWQWMRDIYQARNTPHVNTRQGLNGTYPEVSFTLVAQTIVGLLGVTPSASGTALTTRSHLPASIGRLQSNNVPVGANLVDVRQDGTRATTLTNASGATTVTWTAQFAGVHRVVRVDGARRTTTVHREGGVWVSSVTVRVPAGHAVHVTR